MVMNSLVTNFSQAVAYHERGEIQKAIDLYAQVLPFDKENDQLLFAIGTAYCQLGKLEDGLSYLRKSARLNQKNLHAFVNIGMVQSQLNRPDEAVINFNKAILLNSTFIEAIFGRGNAFAQLGMHEAALSDYERCIALDQSFAFAYNNKGKVLSELCLLEDSVAAYDIAINLQPTFAEAYCNRGYGLKNLGKVDEAIESYRSAIQHNQYLEGAYLDLAKMLYEIGRQEEGHSVIDEALRLNPGLLEARFIGAVSQIPIIPVDTDRVEKSRNSFEGKIDEILERSSDIDTSKGSQIVGAAQPFYLAYHETDNAYLLSKYGAICRKLLQHYPIANKLHEGNKSQGSRLKIGIVSNHIHKHSVWDALVRGWVTCIDRQRFDLVFFYTGKVNDEETLFAKSIASKFYDFGGELASNVELIVNQGIDVLVYPEIGMDPMTIKLASMRLASVQVVSWGHPETSGIPTIDYYLSSELMEPKSSGAFYSEKLVKLPNLGCYYERSEVVVSLVNLEHLGLNPSLPLLICPGTPFKYQPQFDHVLVDVAKKVGPCQFVFFEYHTKELSDLLKARLEAEFLKNALNPNDFLHFLPWQPKETFYGLLTKADAYLDTIGFSGFNTALQALECNLPVVTREGVFMRGRLASGILKRIGLESLIAENESEYVALVVRLIQDSAFSQSIREKIKQKLHVVYKDMEPIRALEYFFLEACEVV